MSLLWPLGLLPRLGPAGWRSCFCFSPLKRKCFENLSPLAGGFQDPVRLVSNSPTLQTTTMHALVREHFVKVQYYYYCYYYGTTTIHALLPTIRAKERSE